MNWGEVASDTAAPTGVALWLVQDTLNKVALGMPGMDGIVVRVVGRHGCQYRYV